MRKKTTALMIAFLLLFQYVNFAGIMNPVEAASITDNIITKIELTDKDDTNTVIASVYESVYYVNPEIRVELGTTLILNYEWELPNGHKYSKDDDYSFDLPAEFVMYSGDLSERPLTALPGEPSVGTYKVIKNKVTVKFNEQINGGAPVSGTLSFWNYFTKQSVNGKTEVEIDFKVGQTITIPIAPGKDTPPISKKGTPDKTLNAENITWTVDVNKKLQKINGAVVTDTIPVGLTLNPSSVKVYKMKTDADGVLSDPTRISAPADYQVAIATANELQINFGDINSSYRIEFDTAITDSSKTEFMNTATLTGTNISDASHSDTVKNPRGKLLEKSGTYNEATQVIDWEVKYNFGEETIANAALIDLFDNAHQLVPGSIKVFPVAEPADGKSGTVLPAADYSLNYNVASHADNKGKKNGFELSFINPNPITGAYKITYQTEPTGNLYKDTTINNTIYSGGKQVSSIPVSIKQHFLHKTNGNANYAARTIDWTVEINKDKYDLADLQFVDTFVNGGLKLVKGSLIVKQNGTKVDSTVYTVTYDPAGVEETTKGFTIDFNPDGDHSYTITYTTQYDYVDGAYFADKKDFFFKNKGVVLRNETSGSIVKEEDTSTFTPNDSTKMNGFKDGDYDATNKKITWDIGINYNSKTIPNAVVTDTLESIQQFVTGSLKVHKLSLASGGKPTRGDLIDLGTDYDVVLPAPSNNNTLTITFKKTITEPYLITFQTDIDGKVIGDTEKEIDNHAYLSGGGYPIMDLTDSVTIPQAGEYVFKEGQQSGETINWKIYINRGQSTVDNAKIFDKPSTNQILDQDSFKLYLTKFNNKGEVTRDSEVLPSDPVHGYTLTFTDETFELKFNHKISKPYILEYQSIIDANDKEKVSNTVTFTGAGGISKPLDNAVEIIVKMSGGSGAGNTYKGDLKVVKVDAVDKTLMLRDATFELTRNSNGEKKTGTTKTNGELIFKDLRYGKYTLKETSAPAGYSIDGTGIYEVTINSTTALVKEIKNNKLQGNLEITKVDSANTSTVLAGATFELFNSANVSMGKQTTATDGKVTFKDLPYGNYLLKEISAPANYDIIGSGEVSVAINAPTVSKEVKNTKSLGSLEITKVDNDNTAIVLAGATFELFNSANVSLGKQTTDANGKATFTGLLYDNYALKEISAPTNYSIIGSGEVTVTINASVVTELVKNAKFLGNLEVTKVDNDNPTTVLAGATFELFNSANVSLGQKTTASNGKVSFSDLPYGSYVLKETSAPSGYSVIGSGEVSVNIYAPTVSQEVKNTKNPVGSLEVTKVDSASNAIVLAGATFEVYNSANVSFGKQTTDAKGKAVFTGLPYGSYVLKEVSAPSGYSITGSGEVTFTIRSSLINTITVKNNKVITPTPTIAPKPTPTPKPTTTPKPTPIVTPAPTTSTEKEVTEVDKPIKGEVEVPDGSVPVGGLEPEHGKVVITPDGKWVYTPDPGYKGKDKFSIIIRDKDGNEEEIFFEIDVQEPPRGGVITTPDVPKLPKTGEDSYLLMQLLGLSMIALGLSTFVIKRKRTRR